ncbi:MAG: RluA family pseudouridine synthase [Anaerolineales bacterium]
MNDRVVELVFNEEQPQRLDKFLVTQLPEFSRSRLQILIKEGRVTIDGIPAHKTGQTIDGSARVVVEIPPPQPSKLIAEDISLDIVFENNDLMVVNKPAGMVVHPSAGHQSGTLVHAALAYAPDIDGVGGIQRPGVVHRLDKDTSGLIVLAKNDATHQWLQEQFRLREVEKIYLALVDGAPPTPRGRVEAAIGRDPVDRKKMAVLPPGKGRSAVSEYTSVQKFAGHTLLEVHPITGRTHQIRLHLAFLDCPVVGDRVYGRRHPSLPLKRQFLHAARLRIRIPGETELSEYEAPLPGDLTDTLESLGEIK